MPMDRPQLIIAPGRDKALRRHHPWVFSGAVKRIVGTPTEGDLVDILAPDGAWMATGHYQSGSIACKVLSFETPLVDTDFLRRRLQSAIDYRRRMGFFDDHSTNVFRLVHAEGDLMPGLVCDWYNGVLVMQAHSMGMHRLFPDLVTLFSELLRPFGIRSIFDKSSATCPVSPGDEAQKVTDGYLWGDQPQEWDVEENGNRYAIDFFEGQKTGFFIDQRENRLLLQNLSRGHRVLNCFGYTGGFSVAALRGGADYVETVDISKKAIELANRNVEANFGPQAPHRGVQADVMKYLDTLNAGFDFIILDPPAFAKNHHAHEQGLKGYRSINQRAMKFLAPGGLLMTFSCSQAISRDDFQTMLFTAAMNAGRHLRIVRQLPHAADHPVSILHPEGEYLKGFLLQIE